MNKVLGTILIFIVCLVMLCGVGTCSFFKCTATGKRIWNNYWHNVQQADENTKYKNRKEVEDTCRSMISSYNADKLTYMQYKDSENELERSWAESAKMRANQTASTYNNYILKNNYIFEENVPSDIYMNLPYLE